MRTKKLVRPVIIILIALTVSGLFVPVSVFAQTSTTATATTILDISCGLDVKKGIYFGSINAGQISPEVTTIIKTAGTVKSLVSVIADDWRDGETRATAVITIGGTDVPFPSLGDRQLLINGLLYIGQFEMPSGAPGLFHIDRDNDEHTAENLASIINNNDRFRGFADAPEQHVFARAVGNQVFLTASIPGVSGNDATLWSQHDYIKFDSDKMYGGKEGINTNHMLSSVTKYSINTNGESSAGIPYSEKTSFLSKGVTLGLTTSATPEHNISLSLQVSGVDTLFNLPYSGLLFQTLTFISECD